MKLQSHAGAVRHLRQAHPLRLVEKMEEVRRSRETHTYGGTFATEEFFGYDANGRRPGVNVCSGAVTNSYFSAGWQDLEDDSTNGGTTTKDTFVWSISYIDDLVARDRTVSGVTTRLFAQQDATHDVTSLVNSSGTVQERFIYDPYGTAMVLTASTWVVTTDSQSWVYTFQGGRLDPISGKINFRNRDLDTVTDTWMEKDAGYFDGANLYQVDRSNPVSYDDPMGRLALMNPAGYVMNIPLDQANQFLAMGWVLAPPPPKGAQPMIEARGGATTRPSDPIDPILNGLDGGTWQSRAKAREELRKLLESGEIDASDVAKKIAGRSLQCQKSAESAADSIDQALQKQRDAAQSIVASSLPDIRLFFNAVLSHEESILSIRAKMLVTSDPAESANLAISLVLAETAADEDSAALAASISDFVNAELKIISAMQSQAALQPLVQPDSQSRCDDGGSAAA